MSTIMKRFVKGIVLRGESSDVSENAEGSLFQNSTELRLKTYIEGAVRQIVTNSQEQTLTNKTIDADNNTVLNLETENLKAGVLNTSTSLASASNTQIPSALAVKTYIDTGLASQNEASEITLIPVGTISSTNIQSAIGELDSDIQNHINDTTAAHVASSIGNTPFGNLAATDVQAALNELQLDVDTRATSSSVSTISTNLQNHIDNTTGAHAASAISNTPSGNLESLTVQSALYELQTDVDSKVAGPGTSTNNAIARFNQTTGKIIKNSVAILGDGGVLTGLTDIQVDDTDPNGIKLSMTQLGVSDRTTGGGLEFLRPLNNILDLNLKARDILLTGSTTLPVSVNSTTTGSNAGINSGNFSNVVLTNSGLISIQGIVQKTNGSLLILTNNTGNDVEILNNASNILTGTDGDITFRNKTSLFLTYSTSVNRWIVIGGTGGATSSVKLIAGEALSANDLVYQSKVDGKVYKASNDDDDKVDVLGFARKAALVDASVEIVTGGVLKGFTGLSVGTLYYLGLSGAITTTAPSTNGSWVVSVGMAVSATELVINPVAAASAIYITDSENSIALANNISTPTAITNLLFDPIQVRSFIVDYSIYREDSLQAKAQVGQLRGVYNTRNGVWLISDDFAGENAGVEFSVTPSGQVQYTTSNFTGTGHDCTMKYTIRRTFTI